MEAKYMESWVADQAYVEAVFQLPLTGAQAREIFEIEIHVSAPRESYRGKLLREICEEIRF